MQVKTINKIIADKMRAWLSSIADPVLREDVKNSLLVSGGCITSMLLKVPVNDYDVYIQNINVLKRLAEYYCGNEVLDGREKDAYIEKRFPDYNPAQPFWLDTEEPYAPEALVRLLTLKQEQIKLDISSSGKRIPKEDLKEGVQYQVAFLSQNAISLTDDIQIVLRFSGSPEEIHKTFDFVHATNYFTFEKGLVFNDGALKSILTKTLVYRGSHYPLTSVIRMKKFVNRGWTINAGEILKMLFQLSKLDLTNIEVLEEQLIGVDVAYFSTLIDKLKGIAPENITNDFMNDLIEEVFNLYDAPSEEDSSTDNEY
jgi:hypothetical protein